MSKPKNDALLDKLVWDPGKLHTYTRLGCGQRFVFGCARSVLIRVEPGPASFDWAVLLGVHILEADAATCKLV